MSDQEQNNNPFKYQKHFVEWMTSLDERTPENSGLQDIVSPDSLYRLETYQSSFLSRISNNLCETLFEACENLFGVELVAQILAGFFKFNPPTAESITEAPNALPSYLRATAKTREALLFSDLAEISIKRWKILTALDPRVVQPNELTPLHQLHLVKPSAYIQACSKHDLATAWQLSESKISGGLPESLFEKCTGVLIAKSSPTDLTILTVPEQLQCFVQALVQGSSVEHGIDVLEQSSVGNEEVCIMLMSEMMTALQAQNLLTQSQN
jgi:hypothetical protein